MRRIVSVWLVDWPVTVWSRTAGRSPPPDGAPFALVERGARGLCLRALNPAARAAGLRRGQTHADARAILPALVSAPAEPGAEARALAELAGWCERWTPLATIDASGEGMEGLLLDVTGGAHLFGGEAGLLDELERAFARLRVPARLALADTVGAAWALARFGGARVLVAPEGARDALAPLPLAALRLGEETLLLARRLGLRRIGDLYAMPRRGLARRFQAKGKRGEDGLALVRRLDQALGHEAEPLDPFRAPPRHRVIHRFAEPVGDMAGVRHHLAHLAPALATLLEADGMGARALSLAGFRTDGRMTALTVRLGRPTRSIVLWLRLLETHGLDRLDLGFGIDALGLAAALAEPLAPAQPGLEGEDAQEERLGEVIDRITARLGEGAVRIAVPHASWLPERATRWPPAGGLTPQPFAGDRTRPILLLDPPEPVEAGPFLIPDGAPRSFKWRRVTRRVARAEGPERLAPEWWRHAARPPGTRDYYRVEDEAGARYWLYREGLAERDAIPPAWWMHGLFA